MAVKLQTAVNEGSTHPLSQGHSPETADYRGKKTDVWMICTQNTPFPHIKEECEHLAYFTPAMHSFLDMAVGDMMNWLNTRWGKLIAKHCLGLQISLIVIFLHIYVHKVDFKVFMSDEFHQSFYIL